MDNTEELLQACTDWQKDTVAQIKADMLAKGVKHRDNSPSKQAAISLVKSRRRVKFGCPERISIVIPKQLIYVHYGVGKHRAKGSGKEHPKEIIDNILEKQIPVLADIAQKHYADLVVRNMFIDKSRGR